MIKCKCGHEFESNPINGTTACWGCGKHIVVNKERRNAYQRALYPEMYAKHRATIIRRVKEYYKRNKKKCNQYQKEWYQRNKFRLLSRSADWYRKKKSDLAKSLSGKCQKCGYDNCIGALEFHHRDPKTKEKSTDWQRKDFDISNVILLCANSHRETHFM